MKLLQVQDLLERAAKWLAPLGTLAKGNLNAWIVIYDVAVRRSKSGPRPWRMSHADRRTEKYLQAVKALNSAHALDADHPELHVRKAHFKLACTFPSVRLRRSHRSYRPGMI